VRRALVIAIGVALAVCEPHAQAIAACGKNSGTAPADRGLPPHPRILLFDDDDVLPKHLTATIDGEGVELGITERKAAPTGCCSSR
jgi:hypothetical protein